MDFYSFSYFFSSYYWLIVYIKCCKNKGISKKDNSDYYNIGGKNIPLDEDSDSGIN